MFGRATITLDIDPHF